MAFAAQGQRAGAGLEWARHTLYGCDRPSQTAAQQLAGDVAAHGLRVATAYEDAGADIAARIPVSGALSTVLQDVHDELVEHARRLRGQAREAQQLPADRPFRVVLMGRTMAGKSTLFEYFSGGDGARVGDGRQRYSRDACVRMSAVLGFEIVDTPGVGAMDGEEDFAAAFEQVPDADLILWVASDQATQEQTGRALRRLGSLGKPIVVVLNCLANLDDPTNLMDFLDDPEGVFGADALDNLHPIERHLAQAGARFLRAAPVHAQAALRSRSAHVSPAQGQELLSHSRIADVITVLHAERDRTASQRRVLSTCDRTRTELLSMAALERARWQALRHQVEAGRGTQRVLGRRAARSIDDAHAKLLAAIADITASRERWVEDVDIDGDVDALWVAEAAAMQAELAARGSAVGDELRRSIQAISDDVAEDWAVLTPGSFVGLPGYGTAWMNRAAKIGGRFAAAAGAGALAGLPFGGVGAVPGAVIGAAAALAASAISTPSLRAYDSLMNRWLRSRATVRERRRHQVRSQLLVLIDAIRVETTEKAAAFAAVWRRTVDTELKHQAECIDHVEFAASRVSGLGRDIEAAIADLDTYTCRELLRLCGRTRAAGAVERATRWHGAGIAAQVRDRHFAELALFPVTDAVEPILPVAPSAFASGEALQVVMGLSAAAISVTTMTRDTLRADLVESVPGGVLEAWQELARLHTGAHVSLTSGVGA